MYTIKNKLEVLFAHAMKKNRVFISIIRDTIIEKQEESSCLYPSNIRRDCFYAILSYHKEYPVKMDYKVIHESNGEDIHDYYGYYNHEDYYNFPAIKFLGESQEILSQDLPESFHVLFDSIMESVVQEIYDRYDNYYKRKIEDYEFHGEDYPSFSNFSKAA